MRLAVLGAGPGGYGAAMTARSIGAQVTVIESAEVGGTCLNRGCIPTKALADSVAAMAKAREGEKFGFVLSDPPRPDLHLMMEQKDRIVSTSIKGLRSQYKQKGISLIEGRGRFIDSHCISVEHRDGTSERIEADAVIIATGSRPAEVPAFAFDGERVLSSDHILKLTAIPQSLAIIGGGVIGCEFASIFRELGSDVTIIELLPRLLATEDEEVSAILEREFKKRKIQSFTGVRVTGVRPGPEDVTVTLEDGHEIKAERLLVAVGRAFNTEGIGLEAIGVQRGRRGEIITDSRMKTNIEGVYAVGDVTGGILLAHWATRQGVAAARNACGIDDVVDASAVPAAVFTSPEVGSVGLREHEAAARGLSFKTGKIEFRANAKAHTMREIAGFVKIIVEKPSGLVLGMHIIGPHAADLVHEGALAISKGMTAMEIADTVHVHPTLSEALMDAAAEAGKRLTS